MPENQTANQIRNLYRVFKRSFRAIELLHLSRPLLPGQIYMNLLIDSSSFFP